MIDKSELLSRCAKAGKSITPQRMAIIKQLSQTSHGVSAYDLLEQVNTAGHEFNISTIYRVLDFWTEMGVVHKIESNNTYLVCNDSHDNHLHILFHCTKCHEIEESCQFSKQMPLPDNKNFIAKKNQAVELQGLCSSCKIA